MQEFTLSINPWFAVYGAIAGVAVATIINASVRSMGFGAMSSTSFIEDLRKPAVYYAGTGALIGTMISALF
jgi:hypothetical protein